MRVCWGMWCRCGFEGEFVDVRMYQCTGFEFDLGAADSLLAWCGVMILGLTDIPKPRDFTLLISISNTSSPCSSSERPNPFIHARPKTLHSCSAQTPLFTSMHQKKHPLSTYPRPYSKNPDTTQTPFPTLSPPTMRAAATLYSCPFSVLIMAACSAQR